MRDRKNLMAVRIGHLEYFADSFYFIVNVIERQNDILNSVRLDVCCALKYCSGTREKALKLSPYFAYSRPGFNS